MHTIPPFAPGCYGSALAFDGESPVCQSCKFAQTCKVLHMENLAELRNRMGVKSKRANAKPVVQQPTSAPAALTVPKKVQEIVDKLERAKIRVTEGFAEGRNPFMALQGANFLKIAGHLLLKMDRPLDRQTLSFAYQQKLDFTEGTADSHARMAMQALIHIGAVHNIDGLIALRRS